MKRCKVYINTLFIVCLGVFLTTIANAVENYASAALNSEQALNSYLQNYDYNKARELIEKHDVISFNIFDTLLIRAYAKWQDMYEHAKSLKRFGIGSVNGKMELSRNTLIEHPENIELYIYAKDLNKKTILVSDVTLPYVIFNDISNLYAIYGVHEMYIANEVGKTKKDGTIYDHILNDLKVKPESILHIGDDLHSDCKMAETRGIHTFYTPKPIDRLFSMRPDLKEIYDANKNNHTLSVLLSMKAINLLTEKTYNYYYDFGYLYLGPLMYKRDNERVNVSKYLGKIKKADCDIVKRGIRDFRKDSGQLFRGVELLLDRDFLYDSSDFYNKVFGLDLRHLYEK